LQIAITFFAGVQNTFYASAHLDWL